MSDDRAGTPRLRVLAISGSLRAASSNSAILRAAALVAPPELDVVIHEEIGRLPFFSPDLDRALDDPALPTPVRDLRAEVARSDALLISSPEYAHGMPGVLKNALDWLVGGPEMVGRTVMLLNTSPYSVHAQASLAETLRTMSAHVLEAVPIELPRGGPMPDAREISDDARVGLPLAESLRALVLAVHANALPA